MNNHFIVCKFGETSFELLKGMAVVVIVDNLSGLSSVQSVLQKNNIHLHCIYYKSARPLSDIIYKEKWNEFPLLIESPGLGKVSNFLKMASVIRKLNIRFYFSTDNSSCYKDIRILSSLGYYATLIINGKTANWDEVEDLMTYSILNSVKHQDIDPFRYLLNYYHPQNRTDFGAVYFNDPTRYLHLTKEGKLSFFNLSADQNNVHTIDLDKIDQIDKDTTYNDYLYKWQQFFLEPTTCACCKGWRICLGKYSESIKTNPGCQNFFGEFLNVVEMKKHNNEIREVEDGVWQP